MKTLSLFGALVLGLSATASSAAPRVVTDIPPVHSLVAQVMAGIGTPALIIRPGASPHDYAMKPSQAAALDEADVVFWIGDALTPWLGRTIGNLGAGAHAVALMDAPGVSLLMVREGARFEPHNHEHAAGDEGGADEHDHGDHAEGHDNRFDPHIWLDPENAKAILDSVAGALTAHDPAEAARYAANAAAGKAEIDAMSAQIEAILTPVRGRAFVTLHDAYHYFEARFGIEAAGAISISDAAAPGPARVDEVRGMIAALDVACVFAEPQLSTSLVETVIDGREARVAVLDPLGVDLEPGPTLYPALMRDLAHGLAGCLGR